MVKLSQFNIEFQNPNLVFTPGERVLGQIKIGVMERFKINCIRAELTGQAYVHWTESSSSNGKSETRSYTGRRVYFNIPLLFMSKQYNQDLYLEPGNYNYPFDFILPPVLPTSIEVRNGWVRYWVEATIDIPWAIDKKAQGYYTVINKLDLNMMPNLKQPFGVSDVKIVCCGPCKSKPILIEFNTPKIGYIPGESIRFNARVDNGSNREIISMLVAFSCQVKLHATSKTRTTSYRLAEVVYMGGKIAPNTQQTWSNGLITIPPVLAPSLLNTCGIIENNYMLQLIVCTSGPSVGKALNIPLVIGMIPFVDSDQNFQPVYSGVNQVGDFSQPIGAPIQSEIENQSPYVPNYPTFKDFSLG